MEEKVFNLVYDRWDEDKGIPYPNLKLSFPTLQMNDPEGLILHYQDDATFENKFQKKKCHFHEVIENPNQNYYYIISHGGINAHDMFLDERDLLKPKILDPLDQHIKDFIKTYNNFYILFLTEHEPDNEKSFKMINQYMINNNIDTKKIYIVNNNSKLSSYKEIYKSNINTYTLNFIPHSSTKVLDKIGGCQFVENKVGKFFMCFNKSPKIHRYGLLCFLKKYNLLDDTNWSLVPGYNCNPIGNFYNKLFNIREKEFFKEEIMYLNDLKFKVSDYEKDKEWFSEFQEINTRDFPIWLHNPELIQNYESSYINIITESMFLDAENNIHISEKSFKPFFYYQFPLILSTQGHIKKMKDRFGFDFYDDIINHDYDNEPNQNKRLRMFVDELVRLKGMKSEIIEYYKSNKSRFESNKSKVLELLEIVNQDYRFWEGLI
jgi:hypothetical protein